MTRSVRISGAVMLFALVAVPFALRAQSDPYAFQRQGVFGCSLNGAYSMSVGAMSAIGGVYVPVNDAAVTLNTGFLVYKECVLRGVVNREREAAAAAINKGAIVKFSSSRNGAPMYPEVISKDQLAEADRAVARDLSNATYDALNPAFRGIVKRAVAENYLGTTRRPNRELGCPYQGDLGAVLAGAPKGSIWDAFDALVENPACNPYFAYVEAKHYRDRQAHAAVGDMMTRLAWGGGVYGVETIDDDGNVVTLTPNSIVRDNIVQILQSGYKQLENANDIDQMVGALYAGLSSQAIGDIRGLAGLTQGIGGRPSYLDQVTSESAQGLRQAAGNAALQILLAAKQIEAQYNQIMRQIADVLSQTISALRAKENQCWGLVISKVCTAPPDTKKECRDVNDNTLVVATSTAFSQAVIDGQITTLASTTLDNISASNKAVRLIDQLIAGVTNTASINAQRVALQQLDSLVAQRALHTQNDLAQAQQSQAAVTGTMNTLVQDTLKAWGDSTDPNVGWCNINNSAVIDMWATRWKKK